MHTQIQGNVYGISLRVREYNYNSFNRHSTDIHSEVHIGNVTETVKPAYHVQFNKISDDKVLVIRVNIDAFGMFLKHLEQTKHLEPYFNKYLEA
jgi:hypothetical protein